MKAILTCSADAIARQERDKKRLVSIIKRPGRDTRRKTITQADVAAAVRGALEDVARTLRFKAKQTPGWAAAYHDACAEIEKALVAKTATTGRRR